MEVLNLSKLQKRLISDKYEDKNAISKFLFGLVEIDYVENSRFVISSTRTVGVLINSCIVMIPNKIDENQAQILSLRFLPYDKNFSNINLSSLSIDTQKENANYKGQFCIRLKSKIEENMIESQKSNWQLILLENSIGETLMDFNLIKQEYLSITKELKSSNELQLSYFFTFTESNKHDFKIKAHSLENKILYLNTDKIFISFDSKDKIFQHDGFVVTKSSILSVYDTRKAKLLDYNSMKKLMNKYSEDSKLTSQFEKMIKNCSIQSIKFLEINLLKNEDEEDFDFTLKFFKKNELFVTISYSIFNQTIDDQFKQFCNTDENILTYLILSKNKINKIGTNLRINPDRIDKNLAYKKLIKRESPQKRNLNLHQIEMSYFDFKTVFHSFLPVKNLSLMDVSKTEITFDKALILSTFLYNTSVESLNLSDTKLSLQCIYIIIESIIQNKNQRLISLNISNNLFEFDSNLEKEHLFAFPENISFLVKLFDIASLKKLNLTNVFSYHPLNDFLKLENVPKHKKNSLIIEEYSEDSGLGYLNLSKNKFDNISMEHLGNYLLNCHTIKEIVLSNCSIDDKKTNLLTSYLIQKKKMHNLSLQLLDLSHNNLTWKGGEYLKNLLCNLDNEEHSQMTIDELLLQPNGVFTLVLNNNLEFAEGVEKICYGITQNSPLLNLHFDKTNLTQVDIESISNIILSGLPILSLSLAGNNLSDSDLKLLNLTDMYLKGVIQKLDVHNNKITLNEIYSLFFGVEYHPERIFKFICDSPKNNKNLLNKLRLSFDNRTPFKEMFNVDISLFKFIQFYKS